ncbi:class F sortase [Halobacillus sp. Marseille-Q1614]|uniref:class F sortase n=1 Tax=Halobacillus sp. Marseille-Q1614 TaxID=2709134 RepID=UPI00157055BB|nr:class F sortase [Halobacillus sp. Marseille-Q1614]
MKWKIYFTAVGLVALLLAIYSTDVWASWIQPETGESQRGELSTASEELTPPSELKPSDLPLDEEFTVLSDKEILEKFQDERKKEEGIIPSNVKIPSLDVDAPIEKVGILENGQMGVPDGTESVGWFEPGTKPGQTGNSVFAGHVDSKTGPAVFFYLDQLEKGDEIIVTDEEGTELTYTVKRMESYSYNDAPIDEVFGRTDSKNLNLITCTGTFNREKGTHEERLVVYTELKEEPEEEVKEGFDIKPPTNVEVNGLFLTWHAVRVEGVAGYRVYQSSDGENFEHAASISAHERKSFTADEAKGQSYYVTTVYFDGTESAPSETVK